MTKILRRKGYENRRGKVDEFKGRKKLTHKNPSNRIRFQIGHNFMFLFFLSMTSSLFSMKNSCVLSGVVKFDPFLMAVKKN